MTRASNLNLPFRLATWTALGGWLVLMLLPGWAPGPKWVVSIAVALLCVLYGWVLRLALREPRESGAPRPGFFTLSGVLALFRRPSAILAAWVHILAFDLMVGVYIRQQGEALGFSHWLLLPCYLLAMLFGPLGLLLFLALAGASAL